MQSGTLRHHPTCSCLPRQRSPCLQRLGSAAPTFRRALLQPLPRRTVRAYRIPTRATAAGAGSDDPYQVLGVRPDTSSETLQRAYRKRLSEAKGDKARVAAVEEAHSRIMMSNLSARLKGGGLKEVKYADKAVYLPWRPRVYVANRKYILIAAALQALLGAWGLLLTVTAGTQPLIASATVGFAMNAYKQNQIFPPPTNPELSSNKNQMLKNFLRGALLAFFATFLGVFLFFTFPDLVVGNLLRRPMPFWFYENESTLLNVGSAVMNFIFTSFYR